MPPLHRMPIAYLALLIAAAAFGLTRLKTGGLSEDQTTAPRPVATGEPREASPSIPSAAMVTETGTEAPDPILRTAEGLRRKVLIKDLGVVARSAPVGGVPVGEPQDYFSIHYVLSDPPPGGGWIEIGDRDGHSLGWLPADAVLEWDTRLMARPAPRNGRPPLVLYREARCLLEALGGRTCPEHHENCPIEGEEPADSGSDPSALGMPILTTRSILLPDGTERTIFEVASLVRDRVPIAVPEEPPPDLVPWLKQVDVAFVIDTTASMQAAIDGVRRLAETLIADASQRYRDVTLRFALIEYRDATPAFAYAVRRVTDFTDPRSFRQALEAIAASERGDGSIDETVLDGVEVALPDHRGRERLRWPVGRAGDLATKLIVLIGDSPDHDRKLTRARLLAERARAAKVTIASVAIDRDGFLQGDEQTRYRDQWEALAQESYRPPSKASGFAEPIAPLTVNLGEGAGAIVKQLGALLDDRVKQARELAALAAAEAEGRLLQYTDSRGLTMEQIAPVLADLHRGEEEPRARRDPRLEGHVAPSVRRGWIAKQQAGRPLVEVEILLSREELDAIIRELTQLQRAVQGNARDLRDLLRIGTAAATGEVTFLGRDRGEETLAEYLRRRRGLPPARPGSLLRRSQSDLLQVDNLFRAAIVRRLQASIAQLVEWRNAPVWTDPRRTTPDRMAPVPYAALDF